MTRRQALGEGLVYVAGPQDRWPSLLAELFSIRQNVRLLLWRAWMDTKARYKRSILGPYWLTIGTLTFVVGYSVLAGLLFQRPLKEFLGYIAIAVVTWQLISATLVEGSKTFVSNSHEILSFRTSLLSLPIRQVLKGIITFLHGLPVVVLVVAWTDGPSPWMLLSLVGFAINLAILFPLATAIGIIAARFRDVEQMTQMLIQFMFYMSPILWKTSMLGDGMGRWVAWGNPFYYMLEVVRGPLLGEPPALWVWGVACGLVALSWLVGFGIYARFRQRVPFWV